MNSSGTNYTVRAVLSDTWWVYSPHGGEGDRGTQGEGRRGNCTNCAFSIANNTFLMYMIRGGGEEREGEREGERDRETERERERQRETERDRARERQREREREKEKELHIIQKWQNFLPTMKAYLNQLSFTVHCTLCVPLTTCII